LFGAANAIVIGGIVTVVLAGLWVKLFPALYARDKIIDN